MVKGNILVYKSFADVVFSMKIEMNRYNGNWSNIGCKVLF